MAAACLIASLLIVSSTEASRTLTTFFEPVLSSPTPDTGILKRAVPVDRSLRVFSPADLEAFAYDVLYRYDDPAVKVPGTKVLML